ncbi:ribonuclease HIII [Limosilactobacillus difficilis]|uniref:ribonuclease HIII n=1 Tax=Limosilactobacillus difficilis TaxID=2991838 RepID=UPI0024BAD1CE|nr:ribonuclease HIII [Limosilactobacillus difficilis]
MQTVIKVSPTTFDKMADYYGNSGKMPTGASFHQKKAGVTITGYPKSHKVMFQGQRSTSEAAKWSPDAATQSDPAGLPAGFASWSVLGSDEVGVGSYFGPLTVAAVYVAREKIQEVTAMGVKDSKTLSDPEIIKLAHRVMKLCPYHIVNLDPATYNDRIRRYNQAQLKALCHNFALSKVLTKIAPTKPQGILIDQFEPANTYFRHLQGQKQIIKQNVFFRVKGEQAHVAVAAASVVARYYSLTRMDALSQQAGLTLPIGAGHVVDEVAAKLLRRGLNLADFAKLHFANTKKATQLARLKDH